MKMFDRPIITDVEEFFNEYVEFFGGQLISKLPHNLSDRPNADYLFKDHNVIAELKCFQKDLFNESEDIPRIFKLLDKWERQRLIKPEEKVSIVLGTKKLPNECYKDMLDACLKTIDRAVYKGNKQIAESKSTFSMPDAKGLLLLCNDGNYFLQNSELIGLVATIMQRKYLKSDIDGVAYFTIKQVARMPKSPWDYTPWVPLYRDENDQRLGDFINELGRRFLNEFYTMKTGIEASDKRVIDNVEEGIEQIKLMEYLPKHLIYKKN